MSDSGKTVKNENSVFKDEGDEDEIEHGEPQEDDEAPSELPPVTIETKVSMVTSIGGNEYIIIPRYAYKYVLCIPQTIALKERFMEGMNANIKEYPIPLDWGLLTEFYINGIKTPFEGLKIKLPHEVEVDPKGKIKPPMPEVRIRG